jgi:thioesterase domain-containing protein
MAGFNAYFVTDTPTLNQDTKATYLAIRGSDGGSIKNLNDWVANDINFALTNSYIPQAKLANQALKAKIKEISAKSPRVDLNVTGHSLGTMISAQAVAKLYQDDPKGAYEKIGKVVLFDGPDVTQSLKNMGLSEAEIKTIGEKVTYYVNPFDVVSMLNRSAPLDKQFGQVNIIVPMNFNMTLNVDKFSDKTYRSSHDFGEFQMDSEGNFLVASESFHPELITAGRDLAKLIDKTVSKLEISLGMVIPTSILMTALSGGAAGLIALGLTAAEAVQILDEFRKDYKKIIKTAKKASKKWNTKHIPDYHNRIRSATGSEKIKLRAELLQSVAQDTLFQSEDLAKEVKQMVHDTKEKVQQEINEAHQAVHNVVQYLDDWEVSSLLFEFELSQFWDTGIEEEIMSEASKYQNELAHFSTTLLKVSQNIQEVDAKGAAGFKNLM